MALYFYNTAYQDYYRIISIDESLEYPFKIEWYFARVETTNHVNSSWFDMEGYRVGLYSESKLAQLKFCKIHDRLEEYNCKFKLDIPWKCPKCT